jgi:hypothetical protein
MTLLYGFPACPTSLQAPSRNQSICSSQARCSVASRHSAITTQPKATPSIVSVHRHHGAERRAESILGVL